MVMNVIVSALFCRYVEDSHGGDCLSRESGQPNYVLTLVLAQLLIGIGGSPLYTLGTAYIDNHVDKRRAPSYIGKQDIHSCRYDVCTGQRRLTLLMSSSGLRTSRLKVVFTLRHQGPFF